MYYDKKNELSMCPVLALFFLHSSLYSGGLVLMLEKMGPALIIACACTSFYTKNLLKDFE